MPKHRLLIFEQISRRMRWRLGLLLLVLLLVGIYDQFTGYLGSLWPAWWAAILLVVAIFFYYAVLMRRASIQARPGTFRWQGPLVGYNISYGRIFSVASGNMEQHYSKDQLNRWERSVLKPFFHTTCVFIELNSYPPRLKRRRLWFPRIFFGPHRIGFICHVDDWMALSREIDTARGVRKEAQGQSHISRRQTLVGRILAEDIEFK